MIGLRWVLDAIGSGLLERVDPDADPAVADVVVAEPTAGGDPVHPGDLVLGVGVRDETEAVALVRRCGADGAAALLLRPPLVAAESVRVAARAAGVALVSVRGQVSWAQLVWLLRSVVDTGSVGAAEPAAFQDLFALADAAAAVIDAPVTIEDEYSRVVAYSHRQEQADAARLSTIVGRRVPADVLRAFRSRGVFRKLGTGSEPIFVPGQPDGTRPRLIVPVRVAGRLLGSIWAIVGERPPEERVGAFADTASVVALHLLRVRAAADVAGRVAAERMRAALSGSAPVDARALELPAGPYRAVALAGPPAGAGRDADPAGTGDPGTAGVSPRPARRPGATEAERVVALWESVGRSRGWRRPAVTDLDGQPYALVTESGGAGTAGSWAWLRRLATELARAEPAMLAAAGAAVPLAELPRSAGQAAALLRMLRHGVVSGPAAAHEDAWAAVVLDRVAGAVPLDELLDAGPLRELLAADRARDGRASGDPVRSGGRDGRADEVLDGTVRGRAARGGWYVETLRAELAHPGDPVAASRALHVHPNTFRYRMRRIRAAVTWDLESPDVRLALQIQLSALRLRG